MNKTFVAAIAMAAFSVTAASSADLPAKVLKAPAAVPVSPWDLAFGAAIMNDYVFRGVTQSNHKPSVAAYFEPRYNFSDSLQAYVGISGESISFANRAAAEIDFYGGIRPTFGKLSLDFGAWYYYYPGGKCYNPVDPLNPLGIPGDCSSNGYTNIAVTTNPVNNPGNIMKSNVSFWEVYGKGSYAITDAFTVGGNVFYSPNFLNFGTSGTYVSGTAKYTGTGLPANIGWYVSGEFGRQWLGTTDGFYGNIRLADYNTWNVGVGFTWKTFTLDLRYSDTDLSKGDCNAFTSDWTASQTGFITNANAAPGYGSKWCGATFIAKLSADLTLANLK